MHAANHPEEIDRDDGLALLGEALWDYGVAAKLFYPLRFRRPFDPLHNQIFQFLQNSQSQLQLIVAPRGIGKTSIVNLVMPTVSVLSQVSRYVIPISCTADAAIEQGNNLRLALKESAFIQHFFGDLSTQEDAKDRFVVDVSGANTCIFPRGAGQQVRGRLYRHWRPDLIPVDDLEDPERTDSPSQREKKKKWFYESLMGCVEMEDPSWKIVVVGTLLHEASLLAELLDDPNWDSIELELCDDNFKSNAPNYMSDETIRALYQRYVDRGLVDGFFREYRSKPNPTGEAADFKSSYFQRYTPGDVNLKSRVHVENYVLCDLAKARREIVGCEYAAVFPAVDFKHERIYVRDVIHGQMDIDEFVGQVLDCASFLGSDAIGIEVTGLEEYALYPFKKEMERRNTRLPLIELRSTGGGPDNEKAKRRRVGALLPFYRAGMVYHHPFNCVILEEQLNAFPRPKLWDVADAMGYLPQMLEKMGRYMGNGELLEMENAELEQTYQDLLTAAQQELGPLPFKGYI